MKAKESIMKVLNRYIFGAIWIWLSITCLYGQKLSEVAQIVGIRENSLVGYGLVIGLNGTGDKSGSNFTMQSVANMLESVNVKLSANDIKSKNIAAVMVTASLPPFARQGDKLDILVSSIGDAKSIRGGTLIMTPLTGVDGNIYALAQGSITSGEGASTLSGSIIDGAIVEREVSYNLYNQKNATLSLKTSDLQNAIKIQQALNSVFADAVAVAVDARTIRLSKPDNLSMVEFLALVEEVEIDYSHKEKIVIDEKSGTIIAGVGITIEPVVITHGDITIKVSNEMVEDANALVIDDSAVLSQSQGTISSTNGTKPTVSSVVKALQKLGASPRNVILILESMKRSGALRAEIEVM